MQRFFWLCLACFATATAQNMPGHVQLRVLPDLAPVRDGSAVKALPRVVSNASVSATVAAGLNARFDRMDSEQRKALHECHSGGEGRGGDKDWAQTVSVTMRGPRFLSLYVEDDWFCAGMPHPDDAETGLVYDLTTGKPVDWPAVLPGATRGYAAEDASGQVQVKWAPLLKAVMSKQDADCRDAFKDRGDQFTVWLDGDRGALMARLTGLTHFDSEMCVPEVMMDVATLQKLGVPAAVTDALNAALHDPSPLAAKRREAAVRQNAPQP